MIKYEIPWSNCIAFGIDNTSVNVGRHKSLIVEASLVVHATLSIALLGKAQKHL